MICDIQECRSRLSHQASDAPIAEADYMSEGMNSDSFFVGSRSMSLNKREERW
jgi:hypothetical protein